MIETKGIVHFTISVTDPEAARNSIAKCWGWRRLIIPPIDGVHAVRQRFRHLNEKQRCRWIPIQRRILRPPRVPR